MVPFGQRVGAERAKASAIAAAVNTVPNLCEPGGGIMFITEVEDFCVPGL